MSFNLKVGDRRPYLALQLVDADGVAADITDADTVSLVWIDPDGVEHTEELDIVTADEGRVQYAWQAGDTDIVGRYTAEVVVDWGSSEFQTFPPVGKFSWFVHPADGINWSNVVATAAQLSTVDTEAQLDILAYVNTALDTTLFSVSQLKLLRVYLAAHLATIGPASGGAIAAGPLVREKLGPAEYQYADVSAMSASGDLDSSPYGQLFTEMLGRSAARIGYLI